MALIRIEELCDAQPNTEQGDELEVLATLIHAFEEEHFPIAAPEPIEVIMFRMEQQNLDKTYDSPLFRQLLFIFTFKAIRLMFISR